ncbi:G-type lectin S-receptor-like serine/threonine-protein kinase At4g03230 [Quercus lobata]|uniref:non-specific serine/threonine protein kinase n=1 Tax=Quercus lobata TaxID=97700 RepID=A0A7N2MBR0_QUELO|nr:G-type lectin S-receptor-like serine/threonine-protein kinase At4g03230 [Quercus lobata]XP_030928461.1 G-type lectin S-receptor-like serine/threonine-protein kinase At4g03230 [Quercus lobata]
MASKRVKRTYRLQSSIFFFFLYIFLFCSSDVYCSARDILKHGEWIIDNGSTLISAGEKFELGFFTPSKSSSSKRFVGLWYYKWGRQQAVVWVANREKPLNGSTGMFGIAEDGNLVVLDNSSSGKEYFSAGLSKSSSPNRIVKLMDSGNLVVSDEDQSAMSLWESFKNPTDTFLSGMKMDEKFKLLSWNDWDDPGPGQFIFKKDELEGEDSYVITKKAVEYWKGRIKGKFMSSDKIMPNTVANLLLNFSASGRYAYNNRTKKSVSPNSSNVRLVMHHSGKLNYLVWDINNQSWSSSWSEPKDQCSIYNACGKFGSCNINNWFMCKCLPGYKPTILENWYSQIFSDGCIQTLTSCDKSGTFLSLKMMTVIKPDTVSEVKNEEDCKKLCVEDCNCRAYSYEVTENKANTKRAGNSTSANICLIWNGDLSDLQEENVNGRNISIRVAKSDIGSSVRNCEPCGTNAIPYPLSTRPNCGDPMYSNFECNNSTGQLSFKSPTGTYRVDGIYPSERKFIIEVKHADISDARNLGRVLSHNHSLPFVNSSFLKAPGNINSNITGVEISWKPTPELMCNSPADCEDWPNSTCNATTDGNMRCLCLPNFVWDASNLNCTHQGDTPPSEVVGNPGSVDEASSRKISLSSIVAVSLISVIAFSCTIIFVYFWRRKMAKRQENRNNDKRNRVLRTMNSEQHVKDLIDSGDFREEGETDIDLPFFDLESILAATDGFSNANKLGQGGYGPVYKGTFPGGQEMAVKRLSSASGQGLQEFKNEVVLIAKLQHRNLVRLRGYCIKGDEKILLYEYMPNKSLDSFLFDPKRSMLLDWEMRFNIILGIARGLLYLHQDSRLRIIHRDMKTSNILLDQEMNPKISDFGLAKIVRGKETESNTARVIGTYGYMAPEYALDGVFSTKSDVFSFGVVLLEIISGKKNTGFYRSEQAMSLIGYTWRLWTETKVLDLMDQTLHESCNADLFTKCVNVGLLCIQEDPSDRPTMSNVVTMLDSETVTVPTPKQPAFVLRRGESSTSSSRPETYTEITTSLEEAA